jgi:hypothetical protein
MRGKEDVMVAKAVVGAVEKKVYDAADAKDKLFQTIREKTLRVGGQEVFGADGKPMVVKEHSGRATKEFCIEALSRMGYEVTLTPKSADVAQAVWANTVMYNNGNGFFVKLGSAVKPRA